MIVDKGDSGHGVSWRVKKRAYLNDINFILQAASAPPVAYLGSDWGCRLDDTPACVANMSFKTAGEIFNFYVLLAQSQYKSENYSHVKYITVISAKAH
ncbi:hypothetical protein ACMYSL_00425 [Klebsiella sp. MISC125]|uniref:hypothetical protein n=1 Tax=Klebsiella sp. MISC125 TaxID=2755386 RepID=UPI003DA987EF